MFHEGKEYHYSQYCIAISCDQGELLFHTLTGALILVLDEQDKEKSMKELVQHWYFVPEGFDEQAFADEIREILIRFKPVSEHKTSFTVFTTTECNARCFYCYEKGIPHFPMSTEVAQEVGKYIAEKSGGEKVNISWFGGEPLCNSRAIDTICDVLKSNRVDYRSIMTSNGYYLDREISSRARQRWHLEEVQITLDGTGKNYNRIKAYVHADNNPFERVLANIESALQEGIKILIRLNMDASNASDLFALVDQMAERFAVYSNLSARVVLLRAFTGNIHEFATSEEANEKRSKLTECLAGYGMLQQDHLIREIKLNHCMADNDTCEVILPDGQVCRCEHYKKEEVSGNIHGETRNEAVEQSWRERMVFPECGKCSLYPRCYNLKKCDWTKDGCLETTRMMLLEELKRQILTAYQAYQNGGEKKE